MRANFWPQAVNWEGQLEGMKLTNIAQDHGGLTGAYGITQSEYSAWRVSQKLADQSVSLMTGEEVMQILDSGYWTPSLCDELPEGPDEVMFQWACNHGDGGAVFTMQKTFGIEEDGMVGPETRGKVLWLAGQPPAITLAWCETFLDNQRAWYAQRVDQVPDQQIFLNGWLQRTYRVWNLINGRPLDFGLV